MSKQNRRIYEFDNFRLDVADRQLFRDRRPITLPSKAFDLLLVLIENRGRLVGKEELYQKVWADQIVEESNLTVQVSAIRKALGERTQNPRYIVTVVGHGYRFVGEVVGVDEDHEVVIETETLARVVIESESEETAKEHTDRLFTASIAPALLAEGDDHRIAGAESGNSTTLAGERQAITSSSVGLLRHSRATRTKRVVMLVSALALMIAAGTAAYFLWPKPQSGPIRSIAVLPFKPLVADDRDESLEMGMADTLIARLSNIREISVRPIGAVRKYAGLEQDSVAAGQEQKVDAIIDGQLQRSGEKIRVTVLLLLARDGSALWAGQFDEKFTNIFAVQDSISERVAGMLAAKLTGEEKKQLTRQYTGNAEAYELYLKGRYHLNRLTDDGFKKSLEYFQQAIEKDSNFALAYAGLAESYNALADFNVLPPKEVYPKSRSAALAALKLDDLLAQAHTALAVVLFEYDWAWSDAETEFKRAIELSPGDSDAHLQYSYYLAFMGQFDEAIAEMKRSQELDPVSLVKITGVGQILYAARRYDEAIEQCKKAIEMDPNLGFAHWLLGLAYMYKGMYEPAILAFQKSIPLSGDSPDEPASLALAYARSGKKADARKILDELKRRSKSKYLSPTVIATIHGALGENDQAFEWLDKAYDERDFLLVLLKVEPMFDPLRSDRRFAELVRRVGLPQ